MDEHREEATRKNHWEDVYAKKSDGEMSWFQEYPQISIDFLKQAAPQNKSARIIDIGGGNSRFVDEALKEGYHDFTLLDISKNAIERSKQRLGNSQNSVRWLESDILEFNPQEKYDIWHDRAAFHFLTSREEILKYAEVMERHTAQQAHALIATFSQSGPPKCSGLEISRYNLDAFSEIFTPQFTILESFEKTHITPAQKEQAFIFFKMRKN